MANYSDLVNGMRRNAITVEYLSLKDGLGIVRTAWYIIDGQQICGRYSTQDDAERNAAALRKIRRASV